MAIPDATATQLVSSVGDFADGYLASIVGGIWDSYAGTGTTARLQYLYTRRDLIDAAMGEVRKRVTFLAREDVGIDASDMLKGLLAMKKDVQADIDQALKGQGGGVTSAGNALVGEMLTTGSTSVVGARGWPDANSDQYRGSPYRMPPRRWP